MELSSVFCESGMRWCTFDCCKLNVRGKLLAISIIVRCINCQVKFVYGLEHYCRYTSNYGL